MNPLAKKAYAEETIRQDYEKGVMTREAFLSNVKSEYHCHGIREAHADGSIWIEEDGKIYRKSSSHKEVLAILEDLNSI